MIAQLFRHGPPCNRSQKGGKKEISRRGVRKGSRTQDEKENGRGACHFPPEGQRRRLGRKAGK